MGVFDIFKRKQVAEKPRGIIGVRATGYAAASIDRLTQNWTTVSQAIDWDLRGQLQILRSRSRELANNNDYARKFLQMCCTHVVGPNGFALRVNVTEPDSKGKLKVDDLANKSIEKAFWDWAKVGNCDVTGKLSLFEIQNLYIKSVARDGEVLIRKVYGANGGKYGFALQILDIERLDIRLNDQLANGNVIKMGVEITPYGKPVAYHLRVKHPGDSLLFAYTSAGATYERVPAEDIYHHFIADRPEQTRGLPWMHSAMTRLRNLGGYEEAAVVAARVGASKMGFYTTPEGDGTLLADGTQDDGTLLRDAEAGTFEVLPAGYDFKSFDPDYPHAQFPEFVKACLRGVSSGLGVAYNTLSNDLEGVNFSSIRTGVLEERDNWMVVQNWMIEQFLNDLFSSWLKFALLNKMVVMPNGSPLPLAKIAKFDSATWQGRRWQWVDPVADTEASVLAINNGLKSRTQVVAEQGGDFDDVIASLAAEQEKIDAAGVIIETPAANVAPQQDNGGTSPQKPVNNGGKK